MKGNASKASIHTQKKVEKELAKIDQAMASYLEEIDKNDASESDFLSHDYFTPHFWPLMPVSQALITSLCPRSRA
jgi:hypothetical protein